MVLWWNEKGLLLTGPTQKNDTYVNSGTSPPSASFANENHDDQPLTAAERKQRRTLGLKLFDVLLYPILTNFAVFGISLWATYMTKHGDPNKGWLQGKLRTRGETLTNFFEQKFGWGHETSDMAKTVAFSFIDGSIAAPGVKLFEDRREVIGKWIDDKLGTTPDNLSVYEKEPKQTWGSVLLGRLATVSVVVPTAYALNKVKVSIPKKWDMDLIAKNVEAKEITGGKTSLNNYLFGFRGIVHSEKIKDWSIGKFLQSKVSNFPDLLKFGYFEAFYTTVCTAGLYVSSRAFARHHDQEIGRTERDSPTHRTVLHHTANDNSVARAANDDELAHPRAQVNAVEAQSRIHAKAPEAALQQ